MIKMLKKKEALCKKKITPFIAHFVPLCIVFSVITMSELSAAVMYERACEVHGVVEVHERYMETILG